jgi:uncharacterized RDD family membrane protein YckC
MDEQWYYSSKGRQLGPVSREMLRSLVVTAQVRATDMVWTAGMAEWSAAQMVPQLMAAPMPAQQGLVPPTAPMALEYAGFWRRFVAYLIDAMVLGVLSAIAALAVEAAMGNLNASLTPQERFARPTFLMEWSAVLAMLIVQWLYFAIMESWHQGTLGKLAMGIYVTNEAGGNISFFTATLRFFAKIFSALLLMIGFLMAGFTEKKQALHDLVAGTIVVRRR